MKQLIRKWADLGVQSKLSAIALLALLGMLVPICLYTAQLRAATQVDRSELMGLPPLQALLDAIAELHAYRATGATDLAARERAGAAIGAVLPRIEGLAQFERSRPALEEFARTWDRLAAATGDQARAAASDAAAEAALGALDAMRDESALVYTPYVHSYHLVIANLVEGPESREALTRLMVELQAGAAPDGSAAPAASAVTRLEAFQRSHLGYRRELEKSIALLDDEATQQLKQAADEEAATYAAASEVLARAARGGAAAGVRASVAAAGADIARSMERLGRVSLETLTSQSKQHLSNDTYAMWRAIGLLTLLAIGIGVLTWHTTRVLVRDIRQAARVAAGIAAGRLDNAIEVASRDEVGQLLGDMQRMQSQVQSVIGAQNEMARRH
ncbi:MAG TPA: HAMP domain-containing protein, partial [Pseudoxanthomonas sp.]|nr:HAMP domain-containing protein [Pseudoxanthomonas sp.]